MIDIAKIRQHALPGDIILLGSDDFLGKLIRNGERIQTPDGKMSRWSHVAMYTDSESVVESTIDFKPYAETNKRLDNGAQFNFLTGIAAHAWGELMCMNQLSLPQRQLLLNEANRLIKKGYIYSISGLVGSLLSYWIFGWKSNPLQTKHSLYCSAFIQEIYRVLGIDFDPKHTARNTSPEMIGQYKDCVRIDITA